MQDRGSEKEPSGGRSRLEDEVLEILVRSEQPTSLSDHIRRKAMRERRTRARRVATGLPGAASLGPGSLLIASIVLAFVAAVVRDWSALLGQLLAIASVAALIGIYVVTHRRPGGPNVKQWRGRDIDLSPTSPAWVESLRDRFRRPPRR